MNSLSSEHDPNIRGWVDHQSHTTDAPTVTREQSGATGIIKDTKAQLKQVLEISPVTMDQLTIDMVKSASDAPLLIEVGDQYASIVATSVLEDGTEVYTLRYGITEVTKFPKFYAISLLYRSTDGNISYQPVLSSDSNWDNYYTAAASIAQQLSSQETKPTITHFGEELTEVPGSRNATANIYEMWKNKLEQDMYLTVFYNEWSDQIGLQMELTKFIDNEGNNSVYIGSMVNGGSIKLRLVVLKYLIENKDKYGVTDDWKVHFFRDDTHAAKSEVRKVWDYYNLAGIPRS